MSPSTLIPLLLILQAGVPLRPPRSRSRSSSRPPGSSTASPTPWPPAGWWSSRARRSRPSARACRSPTGATVIDLGDATLCPGFIDAHTHLTHERTADYNQGFVDAMRREVAEQAILSTVYARRTVEAGFTTVRDVGSGDFLDVGLRNAIAKGVVPGPRMLVCVHALGADRRPRRPQRAAPRPLPAAKARDRGDRQRPRPAPRGGPSPGQVRGRRHQVLRLGRRAVAGRRGGHARNSPSAEMTALVRRGPPAPQEGRLPLPRRPGRPRRGPRRGRLDRARVVPHRPRPSG